MRRLLQFLAISAYLVSRLAFGYGSCTGTQVPYYFAYNDGTARSSCKANTFYSLNELYVACAVSSCGAGDTGAGPIFNTSGYQTCLSTAGYTYNLKVLTSISSGCTAGCPTGTQWNGTTCAGSCPGLSGQAFAGTGVVRGAAEGVVKGCYMGCEVGYGSVGVCISGSCSWSDARYTGNAGTCVVGAPGSPSGTTSTLSDQTTGSCSSSGSACVSAAKPNCAYVGTEYRCATATELTTLNPCAAATSGSVFCRSSANTPPKPNNGVAGMPATPDANFLLTYNSAPVAVSYYAPATVSRSVYDSSAGSIAAAGSVGTSSGTSTSSSGSSSTTGSNTSSGGSSTDTGSVGSLTGGPFAAPDQTTVGTFSESLQNFQQSLQQAPIVQAMSNLSDAVPTDGSAPSASFQAFGRTFTFSVPPEVVSAVSSVLSVVMIAAWSLIGILIFMRA